MLLVEKIKNAHTDRTLIWAQVTKTGFIDVRVALEMERVNRIWPLICEGFWFFRGIKETEKMGIELFNNC